MVRVTFDEVGVSDLTEYRLHLVKTASENVLRAAGYRLSDSDDSLTVHFTTKGQDRKTAKNPSKVNILCEAVVNLSSKTKETSVTSEDYRRLCLRELVAASQTKASKPYDEGFYETVVDAVVKVSLLQVKSSQRASLKFAARSSGPKETPSKGGLFLQYNASRLAGIRRKYEGLASEGIFPPVPSPESVDFGVLKEPEEWGLLFDFLLEYPSLIDEVAEDMLKGKGNLHRLCGFLSGMCSLFSVYYRRVKILLEPRDHLLPVIHARLLLAMSVRQVLENGLSIFHINLVTEM